jgi:hypothetical protein
MKIHQSMSDFHGTEKGNRARYLAPFAAAVLAIIERLQ